MKTIKMYMAGPIFNRNDRITRKQDADTLRFLSKNYNVFLDIYAPIEAAFNLTTMAIATEEPNNEIIFNGDNYYLDIADAVVLDIDNHDAGTMVELGRVCAFNLWKKTPFKIYVLWTNQLCGDSFKNCINKYVLGAIESCCTWVSDMNQVFEHMIKDFNLETK